jgi:hypothetical protein
MMAEVLLRDCLNDGWSLVLWLSQWWLKSCSVIVSMMAEVMFRDCLNDGWSHVPWLSQWWLKSCSVIVSMMAEVLFRDCLNDGWSLMHVPWLSQWWLKSILFSIATFSSNKQLFKKNIYQSYTVMKSYFNISFIYLLLFWEIKKLYQVFFDFPVCSFRQWKFISEWNKKNCCTNSKMTL